MTRILSRIMYLPSLSFAVLHSSVADRAKNDNNRKVGEAIRTYCRLKERSHKIQMNMSYDDADIQRWIRLVLAKSNITSLSLRAAVVNLVWDLEPRRPSCPQ